MKTGKTFIISGPSGVGKSTVLRELLRDRDDLYFSISATTRTPREGEINGVHYHFINVDRFREMIQEDEFLEYAEYVGNFYGTPKRYVDEAMAQGRTLSSISRCRAPARSSASGPIPCASSSPLPRGTRWSSA